MKFFKGRFGCRPVIICNTDSFALDRIDIKIQKSYNLGDNRIGITKIKNWKQT